MFHADDVVEEIATTRQGVFDSIGSQNQQGNHIALLVIG